MQGPQTLRTVAGIYVRGLCMGAADAVPGVSGGTIALITGIYERLIAAITSISRRRVVRIARGVRSEQRGDAIDALKELDLGFLLALGGGILTAVILVLRLISVVLSTHPIETYGFFFGLIAASAIVLYSDVSLETPGRKAAALGGCLLAFWVSGYAPSASESTLPLVFVAGVVAISAMVLPGVSGSLLLIMLGQYEYLSTMLRTFTDGVWIALTGGETTLLFDAGVPIVVFLTGAVCGLFSVAHVVRRALKRYREATVAFLVSLIVGALRAPVEQVGLELAETDGAWTLHIIGLFVGFAVVGACVVFIVDRLVGGIGTTVAS